MPSLRCTFRAPRRIVAQPRTITHSSRAAATPITHTSIAGAPPPPPPQQDVDHFTQRLQRRKTQAELTGNSKRFWKDVFVNETPDGYQVLLDKRPLRTPRKVPLVVPHGKRMLASAIALEWTQLVSVQQATKNHYIPLTSLVSRALDIQEADATGNTSLREGLVKPLMRYLITDTLLCWAPEVDLHDPDNSGQRSLRERQKEVAEPIIAYLKTHVFPGIDLEPILPKDSIVPDDLPKMTVEVIRGWIMGLPAFELAALERGVLATKSVLVPIRLLVEWSNELRLAKKDGPQFDIEQAAEACNLETLHQVQQWGEVEDTHDVNAADLRRQLGSVILLVA